MSTELLDHSRGYGRVSRLLHWGMALLLLWQFISALLETLPLVVILLTIGEQVVSTSFNVEGVVPWTKRIRGSAVRQGALLGEGSFGIVREGTWRGRPVAVKWLKHSAGLRGDELRALHSQAWHSIAQQQRTSSLSSCAPSAHRSWSARRR